MTGKVQIDFIAKKFIALLVKALVVRKFTRQKYSGLFCDTGDLFLTTFDINPSDMLDVSLKEMISSREG